MSTFEVSPIILEPEPSPSLDLIYSASLIDGTELPSDLISFNAVDLEFKLESSDQSLEGTYEIRIDLDSVDERWTGQTVTSNFTLTVKRREVSSFFENSAPQFKDLEEQENYVVSGIVETKLELGPIIDKDGDKVDIVFND